MILVYCVAVEVTNPNPVVPMVGDGLADAIREILGPNDEAVMVFSGTSTVDMANTLVALPECEMPKVQTAWLIEPGKTNSD